MDECLNQITKIIEWYKSEPQANPHTLIEAMRKLTTYLYTLEHYRAEAKSEYETVIFEEVNNGNSVARSANKAEIKVSELYLLRRVMDAAYRVSDSMRSQLSWLRAERTNNGST